MAVREFVKSADTELKMNVVSNPNSILKHSSFGTSQLKNDSFFDGVQTHKHTDVSTICLRVELSVVGV